MGLNEYLMDIMQDSTSFVLSKYQKEIQHAEQSKRESMICVNICGMNPISIYRPEDNRYYFTVNIDKRRLRDAMIFIDNFLDKNADAVQPFFQIRTGGNNVINTDYKYIIAYNYTLERYKVKTRLCVQNTIEYNFDFSFSKDIDVFGTIKNLSKMNFAGGPERSNGLSETCYFVASMEQRETMEKILCNL